MKASWSPRDSQTSKTTQPPGLAPPLWTASRRPIPLAGLHLDPQQIVDPLVLLEPDAVELENQPFSHLDPPLVTPRCQALTLSRSGRPGGARRAAPGASVSGRRGARARGSAPGRRSRSGPAGSRRRRRGSARGQPPGHRPRGSGGRSPPSTANRRHSSGAPLRRWLPRPRTDAGADHELAHGAGDQHFAGSGEGADAAPMLTAMPLRSSPIASTSPLWMPERISMPLRAELLADRGGAADRPRRAVEGGEDAVAERLHLAAADGSPARVARSRRAGPIRSRQRLSPSRRRGLGRADDVGE